MSIEQLTDLFMWMSIINVAILTLSAILGMTLKGYFYKKHAQLFGLKESEVAVVAYNYLGTYRLLVIVFNIVPYIALRIL